MTTPPPRDYPSPPTARGLGENSGAASPNSVRHLTLKPTDTSHVPPTSVAAIALESLSTPKPIQRPAGPPAPIATLEAELSRAESEGDDAAMHRVSAALARALWQHGSELDTATRLAKKAASIEPDRKLVEQLSSWYAELGEPALAVKTLEPLLKHRKGVKAASALTRAAVLSARARDAGHAASSLELAIVEHSTDALPAELLGALGAWAPNVVDASTAARAYLEGFRRRDARGERAQAFEDLLRAFQASPGSTRTAEALARMLAQRGRLGASDEVLREHAAARARLRPESAEKVHLSRLASAFAAGDLPRALGAALDAKVEGKFELAGLLVKHDVRQGAPNAAPWDPDVAVRVWLRLLDRIGQQELLASWLAFGAHTLRGPERAGVFAQLGRLYTGTLAQSERALRAWVEAATSDPGSETARRVLAERAQTTQDFTWLVEVLIRIGLRSHRHQRAAEPALRQLMELAATRLDDPGLALWAARKLQGVAPDAELGAGIEQFTARIKELDQALHEAYGELRAARGAARVPCLVKLSGLLEGRPDESDALRSVYVELAEREPEEHRWQVRLRRLLERAERWDELDALLERELAAAPHAAAREEAGLRLASVRLERSDFRGALTAVEQCSTERGSQRVVAATLVLSTRVGDVRGRAYALTALSSSLSPSLRAVVESATSELLLDIGDALAACDAALSACRTDPSLARPVAVRARIALAQPKLLGPDALERAVAVVVPRGRLCAALAQAYEAQNEPALALAWTQRWLALEPGNLSAARALLKRVARVGDAVRMSDSLAWLLSQPAPLGELADVIGETLVELAQKDAARGAGVARRVLDVMGAQLETVRVAVLRVAEVLDDPMLGVIALERWLAAGAPGTDRPNALIEVCRLRVRAGDVDGASRALLRAEREGAPPGRILTELDALPPGGGSEGLVASLEARAEALSALSGAAIAEAVRTWRELGAARYALCHDELGAIGAWRRAASLDPAGGMGSLVADLVAFGGVAKALETLESMAGDKRESSRAAQVLAIAAGVALGLGRHREAFDAAERALALDPVRTDALAVAERSASAGDIERLEGIYQRVAAAAFGRYGERALHYRAARQLERRGAAERALGHAIAAFEASPANGVALSLSTRIAARLGRSSEVIRALGRVAEGCDNPEQRAVWLKRAAMLDDQSEEGMRQRTEALLRALATFPEVPTVAALGAALERLLEKLPEEREVWELRSERALKILLNKASGSDGVSLALASADLALGVLGSSSTGMEAVRRAVELDRKAQGYAKLRAHTGLLARAPNTVALLEQWLESAAVEPLGRELGELAVELAEAHGDAGLEARLAVRLALDNPGDAEGLENARRAAERADDTNLLDQLLGAAPAYERLQGLLAFAQFAEKRDDLPGALHALERARGLGDIEPAEERRVFARLCELYRKAGRREELEALLEREVFRSDLPPSDRAAPAVELAELVAGRGDPPRALDVLAFALGEYKSRSLLESVVKVARQAGNAEREAEALSDLAELEAKPRTRVDLLRQLAEVRLRSGDEAGLLAAYERILACAPEDTPALDVIERSVDDLGQYALLSQLIARRAAATKDPETVRRLRMRRAALLEQRLGDPDAARLELEGLLATTGDHLGVLRTLAELSERLDARDHAARLWLRASAVADNKNEAAELARRSCEAYLATGDADNARRVLEGMEAWAASPEVVRLRVEVARHSEDPRALAAALEDQALSSMAPPRERAGLFLEASRASQASGDRLSALGRAQRAARIAPDWPEAQLAARFLEYVERGAGTTEQARVTVAELRALSVRLTDEQFELYSFLLAEALDVAVGPGSGARELKAALDRLGPRPLISLGLGERAARQGSRGDAMRHFEKALAGDLRGVRERSDVLLAAAEVAIELGDAARAAPYLEMASADPAARPRVEATQEKLEKISVPGSLEEAVTQWADRSQPTEPPAGEDSEGAGAGAPRSAVRVERDSAPVIEVFDLLAAGMGDLDAEGAARLPSSEPPASSPESTGSDVPPSEPPLSRAIAALDDHEAALIRALGEGDVGAGRRLIEYLSADPLRTRDWVLTCQRLVRLMPGDAWALHSLYEATMADRNLPYARAVDHLITAFSPELDAVPPPPVGDQPEQPSAIRALVQRDISAPGLEALALIWEGAPHIFRRDASTYGITGLERIQPGSATPLARACFEVARLLGTSRSPCFQRKSAGAVTVSAALLAPPAVIVSGDVQRVDDELLFQLGSMMAATWPQHILVFGADETLARTVLGGLGLAFGRPDSDSQRQPAVSSLAEVMWESIPGRSQRRLRELCDDPAVLRYDDVIGAARRAVRRAGLFASANVKVAVEQACRETGRETPADLDGLATLCAADTDVADLLRLAAAPEYAETRWQSARNSPGGQAARGSGP